MREEDLGGDESHYKDVQNILAGKKIAEERFRLILDPNTK